MQQSLGPVGYPVIVAIGVVAIGYIVLKHTRFGRYAYAVGGNPSASRAAALQVAMVCASATSPSAASWLVWPAGSSRPCWAASARMLPWASS